jgi:hypothetical protein
MKKLDSRLDQEFERFLESRRFAVDPVGVAIAGGPEVSTGPPLG